MPEESSNNIKGDIKEREIKESIKTEKETKVEKSYVLYFIAVAFFIIIILIIAIFIFVIKLNKSNTEVIKQLKERTNGQYAEQKENQRETQNNEQQKEQ